jgi:hypothetical protein
MVKKQKLTPLVARKELLIAESELNRIELTGDLDHLRNEFDRIKKQTVIVGSIVSSVGLLATVASVFRRRPFFQKSNTNGRHKAPWIATALEGARIGSSIIMKVRSFLRERERQRNHE